MRFTYAGGSAQQHQWTDDAIAACLYPLELFDMDVVVTWSPTTPCGGNHTYMCTVERTATSGKVSATITVETPANDPDAPLNAGLPAERAYAMLPADATPSDRLQARDDELKELKSFYEQSFVHEIGHVVAFALVNTDQLRSEMCGLFWRTDHRGGVGRRYGTLGDYDGQPDWADRIKEAIAEVFKVACFSGQLVYRNRANWNLDTDQVNWQKYWDLMGLGAPPPGTPTAWQQPDESYFAFGEPIDCQVTVEPLSEVTPHFDARLGIVGSHPGPPGWAYDFDTQIALPDSGIQLTNRPKPWWPAWARDWYLAFSSAGSNSVSNPGEDVNTFDIHLDGGWTGPLGLDVTHDPTQPGYGPHFGLPGLGENGQGAYGSLPRSGFLAYRSMKLSWQLPPAEKRKPQPLFTGWGFAEVTIEGFAITGDPWPFSEIANPQATGETWDSKDVHGNEVPTPIAGGDSNPPWPSSGGTPEVGGSGPFFDGTPPGYQDGYLTADMYRHQRDWTSLGAAGDIQQLDSVIRAAFERVRRPAEPAPPSAPMDISDQTSDSTTTTFRDRQTAPIRFPGGGSVDNRITADYVASPDRESESFTVTWLGPSEVVDPDWGFSVRVRFYPIRRVPPAPDTNIPAGEAYAGQSPAGIIHHGKLPKSIGLRKGLLTP